VTIIDSDILIDAGRGLQGAVERLNAIAATAVTWDMPLISKNQRDYKFISGLELLPYP
jgi:predicted nucleic acid-binding protein